MNAFTRGDSSLGHQPHIETGLRGEALVLESSASIPLNNMARVTLGGWSRWVGGVPLGVRVPGLPVFYPCPMRWLTRSKYPIAETVLPITVDRVDPSILRTEWDQVAEIDDWIAGGHPVFTDPDSAEARVQQALQARSATAAVDSAVLAHLGTSQPVPGEVPGPGQLPAPPAAEDRAQRPAKLQELRSMGVLTDAEFETQQAKLHNG